MFCQKCGKEVPKGSIFCPGCGAKQETEPANMNAASRIEATKYCSNCGAQMPADSRFCPVCRTRQDGAPVPRIQPDQQSGGRIRPSQMAAPLSPEEQAKVKKRNRVIGISFAAAIGACLLIGACLVIGVLSFFIKPSINLNKYLSVSFEGYDTVGKAVIAFDTERFESDYEKKLSAKTGRKSSGISMYPSEEAYIEALFGSYGASSATRSFLSDCVDGSVDKDSGLSNGDVVTYTWNCDDEQALEAYGYKLKYEDVEWLVEGLKEAEVFDPFEGINVVYSGVSSNGSASIEGKPSAKAAQDLRYDIDVYNGLSNGDTITVTAAAPYDDPVEYCIENYGMIPSPLTKEYKVEGLDSYIQSAKDISDECLREMQKQAEDVYNAGVAQNWGDDETLKSFSYIGNYLLTSQNQDDYGEGHNALYLVYKARVNDKYSNDGDSYNETNDIYWYICYYDLLVNPDGVTTVDVSNYTTPDDSFLIDSGISSGWWNTKSWYYYGYQTLDELYKAVIALYSQSYNLEDNIEESLNADEDAEEEEEAAGEDGIIFPASSDEIIDKSDIEALSDEELRYAINELYAKHGYDFKDDGLKAYYEKYDWYDPSVKPEDFSMDLFNDIERENIETMQKERDSR